mmetsp:Transcript_20046/g.36035  ORF Transcript_20046/g.36035 Transcript_20046/m.36035 type:complete len:89 (+) Transcript_20046:465-731(+)
MISSMAWCGKSGRLRCGKSNKWNRRVRKERSMEGIEQQNPCGKDWASNPGTLEHLSKPSLCGYLHNKEPKRGGITSLFHFRQSYTIER